MAERVARDGTWEFFNQGQARRRDKLIRELPSPAEAHVLARNLNTQFIGRIHEAARIICGRVIIVGDGKILKTEPGRPKNRHEPPCTGLEAEGIIQPFSVLDLEDYLSKRRSRLKLSEPCLVYEIDSPRAYRTPPPEMTQMYVPLVNLAKVVSLEQ